VEGKVEVLLNSTGSRKKPKSFKKIVLTKNQWASYRANSNQLKKRKGNIHNMVAWKDHVLVFDNKNLAQVARMLERWYGVKVKIKGNDLKKVVFKGRYDAKSLEKVLDSIQFIFGIHYTLQDSVVTISASG
jgi:ferric-dicitrate binding protein FerR (iron transport regulator)